jgi:site-specific DNA recombinase
VPCWSAGPWIGCGDLVAHGSVDVVLCSSPDRLAAYQALCWSRSSLGPGCGWSSSTARGDSPQDQLLIQFQGMSAEYEKAS